MSCPSSKHAPLAWNDWDARALMDWFILWSLWFLAACSSSSPQIFTVAPETLGPNSSEPAGDVCVGGWGWETSFLFHSAHATLNRMSYPQHSLQHLDSQTVWGLHCPVHGPLFLTWKRCSAFRIESSIYNSSAGGKNDANILVFSY